MYPIRMAIRRVLPQLYFPRTANSLNINSSLFFRNFTTSKSLKNRKLKQIKGNLRKQNQPRSDRGRSSLAFSLPGSKEYELSRWLFNDAQRLFKKQLREFEEEEKNRKAQKKTK